MRNAFIKRIPFMTMVMMMKMSFPNQEVKLFFRSCNQSENRNLHVDKKPKSSSSPPTTTYLQLAKPLYCSLNQLWHLHFCDASSTSLHKLLYIKSSYDSTCCIVYIRAKQTRKPFQISISKVSHILECIHSDICGLFSTSKGLTKLLLTFLDEYSHWYWTATIDDKFSTTVNWEFHWLVKQIETETQLKKTEHLRTDGSGEYEHDLTPVLKEMKNLTWANHSLLTSIKWQSWTPKLYSQNLCSSNALPSQSTEFLLSWSNVYCCLPH